jgi:hypothetical protein
MPHPGKTQLKPKPEGHVRQSQLVTTFGPGAMMDLLDQAVLVGGLDFWSFDRQRGPTSIVEPRLRDALVERFRSTGQELAQDAFRSPPAGKQDDPTRGVGVMVLEFPAWFVCQNPRCRALTRKEGLELKAGRYRHQCASAGKASETVPVRFLGACKRGHCQEFPWIAFAHELQGVPFCGTASLELREGATGDFSEITVHCACGAKPVRLSNAMGGMPISCDGLRPWLGPEGKEPCDEKIRLLVRTASNSYFAQVVSALSVPEPGKELQEAVQKYWAVLKNATAQTLPVFRTIDAVQGALADYEDRDVLAVVADLNKGVSSGRLPLRTAEFTQLAKSPPHMNGELPPSGEHFFARSIRLKGALPAGLARVVVAHKLREVRAQIGFTRLEPVTADLQGEFDLKVESARLGLTTNWLPATEINGEGVFIQLDEAAVRAWEQRPAVVERGKQLFAGYDAWTRSSGAAPPFPGARFYMLHSLSHLLIAAISLECGYSASAIRERIYCGPSASDTTPMAAILISTGTSGTEGTLGGLVEQGARLREHLQRAYDIGRLCSNDPVCAAHSPREDRAERFLEGAGCHGCLFIAESSCERFNRYLDRALVVPAVGHAPELAFLGKRP